MAFTTDDGRTQTALAEINMVPFIDIVLVLLIIFMITSPMLQSAIPVELPRTSAGTTVEDLPLTVTIDRDLRLYLDDEPMPITELIGRISQFRAAGKQGVSLRVDETVRFSTIAMVLDQFAMAGIQDVNLVTEPIVRRP
ncbi:MAG: biopolymer transporter ExbD [Gemmatimonadota bacterium]|jgi:biopolymer transport protein ExbD/biopolymer transport protein TolR|nr:biopolymer transporter ExbD [Gemmatimonadota bacterium]